MPRLISITTPALLVLLLAVSGHSQTSVGVRGGFSYSELAGEIKTDSKSGFLIGAFVGFGIAGNLGIRPEISYVQKGAKVEGSDLATGEPLSQTTDIDYFELLIPVGIDLAVEGETVQPRLYVGPTLGLALSCEFDPDTGDPSQDCKDDFKSSDFGVVFGVGVELGSGPGAFLADLRYDYGIADINDTGDNISKKNRSIQLSFGYRRQF
ncbi:MAG: porin family protein [Gemmatimonadales bacterium]|jgi:hypothetical protein